MRSIVTEPNYAEWINLTRNDSELIQKHTNLYRSRAIPLFRTAIERKCEECSRLHRDPITDLLI